MRKITYDQTQQRILLTIGLLERITMDEPLDVQVNLIKSFCNSIIKGGSDQSRRDDLLSAIKRLEQLSENLSIAAEYLKGAALNIQRKLETQVENETRTATAE